MSRGERRGKLLLVRRHPWYRIIAARTATGGSGLKARWFFVFSDVEAPFPLALGAIRGEAPGGSARSFSSLYVANVVGATAGTLASAFVLIELLGFRGTLALTACLNAVLAAAALLLSLRPSPAPA